MILSIVAVGEKYIKNCIPFIPEFIDNQWVVHVLTDQPDFFNECEVELYENKIFSYFDKLLFTLRLSEKYKEDVLYIDADWIHNISPGFPKEFQKNDSVLYYGSWPNGDLFLDYKNDPYFNNLIRYWEKQQFIYDDLKTMLEWMFFIPYSENLSNIIYDIEHIKPVFEYNSVMVDTGYPGIGNGEGLALSYALHKNKISIKKFDKI